MNCGAISPQLFESEMFGHEKGSFTGADRQRKGFFECANGGTLFLDEVPEMPQALQVKLLRVLESGTFMRVGSGDLHETTVRIIAATNMQPEQAVSSGKLREDLFYRLNVFPISLPPLRERKEDIPLLAQNFLMRLCKLEGQEKHFTENVLEQMVEYGWPGNVRELRNAVQRSFVMVNRAQIDGEWLCFNEEPTITNLPAGLPATLPTDNSKPLLEQIERSVILTTLEYFTGHRENAAATLGVSPKTLYNRLKKYQQEQLKTSAELE